MFNNQLFRCSSLGALMTEPRAKSETLSETTKAYLRQLYREVKYDRKCEVSSKYLEKGILAEEDSITLYSLYKKRFFKKNEDRLSNGFLSGTPDLFIGESIDKAAHIIDLKTSWNLFTFPFPGDKIDKGYFYQLQGYMALTGAESATLAYCLVDTPLKLINDEKRKLLYKMDVISEESPDYVAACDELERNMTFQDIPLQDKVIEFSVTRDADVIEAIYTRIDQCRGYLNNLEPDALIAQLDESVNATIIQTA